MTDAAGQSYKTVNIGSQTWMAENLNYSGALGSTGVCYHSSADFCKKYGRLYTWAEVMVGHASSTTSPSGVQGICPTGWHVPSDSEWTITQRVVDTSNTKDGTKLKSTSGWSGTGNGKDDNYGFRALPGGYVNGGSSDRAGYNGRWWSATEDVASNAWVRGMGYSYANVNRFSNFNAYGDALRCLED